MVRIEDSIKAMIDERYGSIPKFAAELGMSPQTIYTVLRKGINGGLVCTVLPILAKLGIDANWIVKNRIIPTDTDELGYVEVPLYSSLFDCMHSESSMVSDAEHPVPAVLHNRFPNAFLLEVPDEAVDRILPKGSYALVDPCDRIVEEYDPYVVCLDGSDALIRRVKSLNNGLELIPDSTDPTYPVRTVNYNEPDASAVSIVGRVVWYCIPFDWSFRLPFDS